MLGAIIGDVVGSRFEFNNHLSTKFPFFHPSCRFTDDTVCTMAVADWLVNVDKWDRDDQSRFALCLQSWCRSYPMGDYGGMFRVWINNPVPYDSFGNGSAMRVAPVGFAFLPSNELMASASFVSRVSHNHPEGIKGAQSVALAISMARTGFEKWQIKDRIVADFGYSLDSTCDQIRESNYFNETCQVTVPQALTCFFESTDFESCIRLAVSIGGDTDTIACMAGGIAEAFYGVPAVMALMVRRFLPPRMLKLLDRFYVKYPNDPF